MKHYQHLYYILVGREPRKATLFEWAEWFEHTEQRVVSQSKIGAAMVSTVFLGLNHRFLDNGPPILFETMVFFNGTPHDEYMERYCTFDEALAGHNRIVTLLRETTPKLKHEPREQ